jgi:hypothetical protein
LVVGAFFSHRLVAEIQVGLTNDRPNVGVVLELVAGSQVHAVWAVLGRIDLAVEEPLRQPVAGAGAREDLFPVADLCPLERFLFG